MNNLPIKNVIYSLSENRRKNSHRSNVEELLESVGGDLFQRHVCQPSAGHMKSVKKSKGNANTSTRETA